MREYEKIETMWMRDTDGSKNLKRDCWRNETVEFLKDNVWEWTEKVDGTNVSIVWDGHSVSFHGRTEKAQMPVELVNRLNILFGGEENAQMFEQMFGEREVILYGEGYGRKIQNGGAYKSDGVDFILFDLFIAGNYQSRESVASCANAFGIDMVPIVGRGTLDEAVSFVMKHPMSRLGNGEHEMEGLVCRPVVELRDRCDHRVIVKIKWNDIKRLPEAPYNP